MVVGEVELAQLVQGGEGVRVHEVQQVVAQVDLLQLSQIVKQKVLDVLESVPVQINVLLSVLSLFCIKFWGQSGNKSFVVNKILVSYS